MVRSEVRRGAIANWLNRKLRKFLTGSSSGGSSTVEGPEIVAGSTLPAGDARRFLGISIQRPTATDKHGNTIDESPAGQRLLATKLGFIRYHAGTDSYNVLTVNDADLVFVRDTLVDSVDGCLHHITVGPQLGYSAPQGFDHAKCEVIVIYNEPPSHLSEIPGGNYVQAAKDTIAASPGVDANKFYLQSGRPEFFDPIVNPLILDTPYISPNGALIHSGLLDDLSSAIKAGELPPRLATTFKIFDNEIIFDRYDFMNRLLDAYVDYGIEDIIFHEFKIGKVVGNTFDLLAAYAEMLLLCVRLRKERSDISVNGLAFQQGYTINENGNLINLSNGEWVATDMFDFFEAISDIYGAGQYLYSNFDERPNGLYIEFFEYQGSRYAIFCNKLAQNHEVQLNGTVIYKTDYRFYKFDEHDYEGEITGQSVGIIKLK